MQTKKQSLIEAIWNGLIGIILSTIVHLSIVQPVANAFVWNLNDLLIYQSMFIGTIFLLINTIRSWVIRRFFNSKEGQR